MFFHQTFALIDLWKVALLFLLEASLSFDNSLALASIANTLPKSQRKSVLFIGVFSAFILRFITIIAVFYIVDLIYLQIFAGLYLIYLGCKFFFFKPSKEKKTATKKGFWKTVFLIEFTDFSFSLDSIFAGIGLISGTSHVSSKLWIVYVGGMIGLIFMRFFAKGVSAMLQKFPFINLSTHLILILIGLKLIMEVLRKTLFTNISAHIAPVIEIAFWSGVFLSLMIGLLLRKQISK